MKHMGQAGGVDAIRTCFQGSPLYKSSQIVTRIGEVTSSYTTAEATALAEQLS